MTVRVAINGFGRIGRNIVRALYEGQYQDKIKIVAINDLGGLDVGAHLLKYDTAHGVFNQEVSTNDKQLLVGQDKIDFLAIKDCGQLPWQSHNIDVVLECTGQFNSKTLSMAHIEAGAKKVLVSAPAKDADATVVYGVNQQVITPDMQIVSNASCTTNCLAPLVKPLEDSIGIESGLMTTIHAYTNDQNLSDVSHSDLRRARAAAMSMIPTKTGAANAIGLVLPQLNGRFSGTAIRVPTLNVSLVDLTFIANRSATVDEINTIMQQASQQPDLKPVLATCALPLVSIDYNHNPMSCTFDLNQTQVNGRLVKVMAWYDNEWGFSNRMLDTTLCLIQQ